MTIYLTVFSLTMARAGSHLHHQVQTDTTDCNAGWLWTISCNGLQQKSFIFGTCHGDGHQFTAEEMFCISGLENALGKVEKVIFEGGLDTTKCVMDSCHQGEYHSPSQYDRGCRHLMGSKSLIALLRREGYTVEQIKNK